MGLFYWIILCCCTFMASAWSIYSNIFYPSKLMIEIILATSSYPFINLVLAQHSSPIYTFSTFKNRLLWVFKIQYSIFSRHLNSDLRSGIVCEILHIFSHSLIWAKIWNSRQLGKQKLCQNMSKIEFKKVSWCKIWPWTD